ncbi:hypothetical protein Tco_0429728 [Tanacetum coccineum]
MRTTPHQLIGLPICFGVDLEPDKWIKDSRCSKHMTGNRKLFSSYKAYNRCNVIFGSNLRGNIIDKEPSSKESSSRDFIPSNLHQANQPIEHLKKWTKNRLLNNVIGNPSRPVSTRRQLQTDAMWCYFDAFLTKFEPKNFKEALKESSWIEAIQEEIHEFDRL